MEKLSKAYEVINDRIIELLNQGVIPWRKPWTGGEEPMNMLSKKAYRGINVFLLSCSGFGSRYWMSYKQAAEKGGQVRKGEKGFPVIFWKWQEREKENGEKQMFPILRYYTVFNLEQIDGIKAPLEGNGELKEFCSLGEAEKIVNGMPNKPVIEHSGFRACYVPSMDQIKMPIPEVFHGEEEYYQTLFHEMVHSTGHESRLNRRPSTEIRMFGDREYSQEELVAEMGAAFLCGECGVLQSTIENSAAYIASWLTVLKNNKKILVNAAAQAQKAADYILRKEVEAA